MKEVAENIFMVMFCIIGAGLMVGIFTLMVWLPFGLLRLMMGLQFFDWAC